MFPKNTQHNSGFTLIELLVTVSIIVLVTGLALSRYSSFNSTVLLNSEAHEVALDVRRAQSYGLSASGLGGSFRDPYGVYFNLNRPGRYIFFQDSDRDGRYDTSEQLEVVKIDPRYELAELCTESSCNTGSGAVSVLFQRPNFLANFWSSFDGSVSELSIRLSEADSGSPKSKVIKIESTGYIDIQ